MLFAVIAFLSIFLLLGSAGLLLFQRNAISQRIAVALQKTVPVGKRMTVVQQTGAQIGAVVGRLERVIPKSQAEVSVAQQRMIRAGYRSDNAVKYFYGSKVLIGLVLCFVVTVTGLAKQSPLFFYIGALAVGYLAPDFWIGRVIKNRQTKIRLSLPDVMDLLVICVEAGLGLDQAVARTAQELNETHPALSDELGIVVLEQRAGRSRQEAWRHLADRTDLDVIRNVVSMLIQAEQFGTSVAKTLRTHSETMRTQRMQAVEEMAAKTTIKLIFPLVIFIFPCLFLVTIGPPFIMMADAFGKLAH